MSNGRGHFILNKELALMLSWGGNDGGGGGCGGRSGVMAEAGGVEIGRL